MDDEQLAGLPGYGIPGTTQIAYGGRTRPYNDAEFAALRKRLGINSVQDLYSGSDKALANYEQMKPLLMAAMKPQLDLSPLMALGDAESKRYNHTDAGLLASYKRPSDVNTTINSVMGMDDVENKLREATEKNRTNMLAHMMTAQIHEPSFSRKETQPAPKGMTGYDPLKLEADTQKLQKNVGDQLPGIVSDLQELHGYVKGDSIPGIGPMMKIIPDIALSKDASRVRQLSTDLYRKYVYLSSGKQINETEAKDLMKIAGISWDSKESSFRSGMGGLAKQIKDLIAQKEAAYRPEVLTNWRQRGGLVHTDIPSIGDPEVQKPKLKASDLLRGN